MWEHAPGSPCVEPSGDACDHYHRYPDDIRLLAELGFGSYRFSIEWARIEPEEGEFSNAQLDHYRRVLAECHEAGLSPTVTFHHFTSPRWVGADGAWDSTTTPDRFARYCERAGAHLGDFIDRACTINEPNIVALYGYERGLFAPGTKRADARKRAGDNFMAGHRRAVDALKSGRGEFPVGLTLAMSEYEAVDGAEGAVARERAESEDIYLEAASADDFIGVQTYTRRRIGSGGELGPPPRAETTAMGYEFRPQALEATIRRVADVIPGVSIVVTENGIATTDDTRRIAFVTEALQGVGRCLDDGIDVRGYYYWSALDNFEWALGYAPTFGLIAVDRTTQVRRPKPSAGWLGGIARTGVLESD